MQRSATGTNRKRLERLRSISCNPSILVFIGIIAIFTSFRNEAKAQDVQLISNGDFETGDFTGWNIANIGDPGAPEGRNFYISTPGADTPTNSGTLSTAFFTASHPSGGNYYAVSTSDGPGESALYQFFTVPVDATALTLTYDYFVNDQTGLAPEGIVPAGTTLDYTSGGTFADNQHAQFDIMNVTGSFAENPFAVGEAIAYSIYNGVDVDNPAAYTHVTLDLSSQLNTSLFAGQTYALRFAEVDNLSAINVGVDNIHLAAQVVVPEANSMTLLLTMLPVALFVPIRRRYKSVRVGGDHIGKQF